MKAHNHCMIFQKLVLLDKLSFNLLIKNTLFYKPIEWYLHFGGQICHLTENDLFFYCCLVLLALGLTQRLESVFPCCATRALSQRVTPC